MKFGLLAACLALASFANSQADPNADSKKGDFDVDLLGKAHEFTIFGGESLLILGTEDRRTILGASYGYVRPDKRLAFRGYPAQMVQEIKFDYSRAGGEYPRDPRSDMAIGALFYAHYEWPWQAPRGFYFDWGGGAESVQHTSHDLPLSFNGALMLGFGYHLPVGSQKLLFGIRYYHISNAGRKRPNFGQNQIEATVGIHF